jgi:hypothetical protein
VLQSTQAPTIHATARAWVIFLFMCIRCQSHPPSTGSAAPRAGPAKKRPARVSAPACLLLTAKGYLTSRIFVALASVSTDS